VTHSIAVSVTAGGGIGLVEKTVAYLASNQRPQSIKLALECFEELPGS
jgi:hypothetical protein